MDAQLWFERGQSSIQVRGPVFFIALGIGGIALYSAFREGLHSWSGLGLGDVRIPGPAAILIFSVPVALGVSMLMAGEGQQCPEFTLTPLLRPLSIAQMVVAKVMVAAQAATMIFAFMIIDLVIAALMPARVGGNGSTIETGVWTQLGSSGPAILAVAIPSLLLACWFARLPNPLLWSKRKWSPLNFVAVVFGLVVLGLIRQAGNPHHPVEEVLLSAICIVSWGVLALKIAYISAGVLLVRRRNLIGSRTLIAMIVTWLGTSILLIAGYRAVFSTESVSTGAIVLTIFLLVPLNRFLWMVVNLDSVRHG